MNLVTKCAEMSCYNSKYYDKTDVALHCCLLNRVE